VLSKECGAAGVSCNVDLTPAACEVGQQLQRAELVARKRNEASAGDAASGTPRCNAGSKVGTSTEATDGERDRGTLGGKMVGPVGLLRALVGHATGRMDMVVDARRVGDKE
jgi:hypothetical protein